MAVLSVGLIFSPICAQPNAYIFRFIQSMPLKPVLGHVKV